MVDQPRLSRTAPWDTSERYPIASKTCDGWTLPDEQAEPDVESLVELVEQKVAEGERLKAAAGDVAKAKGVSKRELYEAVLRGREKN